MAGEKMSRDPRSSADIPAHVAIIMDGNGRWAQSREMPRLAGHQEGAKNVERVIRAAVRSDIKFLSLYAFSTENWNRPQPEIEGLMGLFRHYLKFKLPDLKKNGVRLLFSGRKSDLPDDLVNQMNLVEQETSKNKSITVIICVNYGGRQEIVDSVNRIIEQGFSGPFTEELINSSMYQPHVPDPDLVIRTSGEIRLSNFLLWQSAYSELYFTDVLWPDFCEAELQKALKYYSGRERRYGSVKEV
ncbi:MAG: polyprenyl diphosphate synthase [Thermovirgaceae bacterium]|nr:polyprenyl diphosphate synthase [Thermovirgaceae bacterium]